MTADHRAPMRETVDRVRSTPTWVAAGTVLVPVGFVLALAFVFSRETTLFWVAWAASLLGLTKVLHVLTGRPSALALALAALFSSERLIVAAAVPVLQPEQVNALLIWDEFVFPIIILLGLMRYARSWPRQPRPLRILDIAMATLAAGIFIGAVLSEAPLIERVLYARRFLLLPMTYLAARMTFGEVGGGRRVAIIIFTAGVALACFGLIERFSPPGLVWGGLADPNAYYSKAAYSGSATSGQAGNVTTIDGLPPAFWSFELGVQWRRLVSTFLEAPTLSMYLALAFLLGLALTTEWSPKFHRLLLAGLAFVGIGLALTLGKAGWAVAVTGSIFLVAARLNPRLATWRAILAVGVVALGGLLVAAGLVVAGGVYSGLRMHLAGLSTGVETAAAHPFGLGLGTSGVFSAAPEVGAGESMLGVLLAQMGWPVTLIWVLWLTGAGVLTAWSARPFPQLRFIGLASGVAVVLVLASSVLTESVGGLVGMWAFGFAAGAVTSDAVSRGSGATPDGCEAAPGVFRGTART